MKKLMREMRAVGMRFDRSGGLSKFRYFWCVYFLRLLLYIFAGLGADLNIFGPPSPCKRKPTARGHTHDPRVQGTDDTRTRGHAAMEMFSLEAVISTLVAFLPASYLCQKHPR